MDATNPLSVLAIKRRVTALGPGGLSRDRAGMGSVTYIIRTMVVCVLLRHQRGQISD